MQGLKTRMQMHDSAELQRHAELARMADQLDRAEARNEPEARMFSLVLWIIGLMGVVVVVCEVAL